MTVGATINVGGVAVERHEGTRFDGTIVLRIGGKDEPGARQVVLTTIDAHELGEALLYVAGVNAREVTP